MKTEEQLLHFYNIYLKNEIDPLEKFRLRETGRARKYSVLLILGASLLILSFFSKNGFIIFICFFLLLFFIGAQYEILTKMRKLLVKEYKYKIIKHLLKFLFEDYEYIPKQKIAKSVLDKSRLFPHEIAQIQGEDFMRFRIGETDIMFCEAIAFPYPPGIKKLFQGVFISSAFNKKFNCETYIFPEKSISVLRRMRFHILAQPYKIHLENIEFEKEFMVLGSDQIESRYILTPEFIKRLLDYKKKTGSSISFSFIGNRMYCAIPNKEDLFEPAFKEPFDFEFLKKSYYPIKLYTDIVEDLNLNLRIWTKN